MKPDSSPNTDSEFAVQHMKVPKATIEPDEHEELRYDRVLAMNSGRADAVPHLIGYLGDTSWRIRRAALTVLDRFRNETTLIPALIAGLASSDSAALRNACAQALIQIGSSSIGELQKTLVTTPDPDHRKFIIEVLGGTRRSEARDVLIDVLFDSDPNVSAAAAEALGQIGGDKSVKALMSKLEHHDTELVQQVYVLDALVNTRVSLPLAQIEPWLHQSVFERQVFALLGNSGDVRAISYIVSGFFSTNKQTRSVALRAFNQIIGTLTKQEKEDIVAKINEPEKLLELIIDLIRDADASTSRAIIDLLAVIYKERTAPIILEASLHHNLMEEGIRVINSIGKTCVHFLIEAFEEAPLEAKILFLEVIEMLGEENIVSSLLEIAYGPETRTSEASVRAIGALASADTVEDLMQLTQQGFVEMGRTIAIALSSIGRREPDAVAQKMRQALEIGDERSEWLVVLGAIGREKDLPVVINFSHHRDQKIRCAAIEAARAFGADFPEHIVVFALADEHPGVRLAAARALGAYRTDTAVRALLTVMQDTDPWVTAEAIRALGYYQQEEVQAILESAADSSFAPIAIAALQSLFRLNPSNLARVLVRAVRHPDAEVNREAIKVSSRLSVVAVTPILTTCLDSRYWNVRAAAADALVKRGIVLPLNQVHRCMKKEQEAVVQEAIEQLLKLHEVRV